MSHAHVGTVAQAAALPIDWHSWLKRWDVQQTAYLPEREARFTAMLDVLDILLSGEFIAVDLACGPGAISQRLLARFPKARCVAVDLDPVLLAMGQGVLGDMGGRLRWVEADLMRPDWVSKLGVEQVDAVLSTTALHWLAPEHLTRVYRELGELIRPGGVFLNGDNMKFAPHLPSFRQLGETVKQHREEDAFRRRGMEDWQSWWEALERESALKELFAERARRFAWKEAGWHAPIFDVHEAALHDAGFREVGVIWQCFDNRVLLAVR